MIGNGLGHGVISASSVRRHSKIFGRHKTENTRRTHLLSTTSFGCHFIVLLGYKTIISETRMIQGHTPHSRSIEYDGSFSVLHDDESARALEIPDTINKRTTNGSMASKIGACTKCTDNLGGPFDQVPHRSSASFPIVRLQFWAGSTSSCRWLVRRNPETDDTRFKI